MPAHPLPALEVLTFVLRGSIKAAGGGGWMMGGAETVIKAWLTGAVLAGPAANERGAAVAEDTRFCSVSHLLLSSASRPVIQLPPPPPSHEDAAHVNMPVSHRGPR